MNMEHTLVITKADGEQEPFDQTKLMNSLEKANASLAVREGIVQHIMSELRDGDTTQHIYEHAFELLRQREKDHVAARYSIKRAVLDLGPTGFPFEQFLAEIFKTMGYTNVRTGVAAQGKCAPHEVDVMALHGDKHVAVEAKFHNSLGIKTDLKVALYVKARFEDLHNSREHVDEGWLITNTRFTKNVIRYAHCANMNLLGWAYPQGRGLEVLIDKAQVHPITALISLSNEQKRTLLDSDIVLCRQMKLDDESLHAYNIPQDAHQRVRREVNDLCHTHSQPKDELPPFTHPMTTR